MSSIKAIAIYLLIIAIPCLGQSTLDYRNKTIMSCSVGAQANFSAKKMNIRFQEKGVQWGGSDEVLRDIASSVATTTAGSLLNFDSDQASIALLSWVQTLFPPTSVSYIIGAVRPIIYNLLASNNIGNRTYLFFAPTRGTYRIQCDLKGDWDEPRNRVGIFSKTGQVFSYDRQLVSDRTETFNLELESGPHWIVVGLGGGSSVLFHTAGRLSYVGLDDVTLRQWSVPVTTNFSKFNALSTLPAVGSTAILNVMFTEPNPNPDILDGSPVAYTNFFCQPVCFVTPSPAPLATWKDPGFEGCYRWVVAIEGSEYQPSKFNNFVGTFYVQRTADSMSCE